MSKTSATGPTGPTVPTVSTVPTVPTGPTVPMADKQLLIYGKSEIMTPLAHWPTDSTNYKEMLSHLKSEHSVLANDSKVVGKIKDRIKKRERREDAISN